MKKIFSIITMISFMMIGLSTYASAAQEMSAKKVQRLDRKMTKKRAHKKRFRTQKEYKSMKQRRHTPKKRVSTHRKMDRMFTNSSHKRVQKRYASNDTWYDDNWNYPRGPQQKAYRTSKRGWYLAYYYDRAHFNDRYGYEYGYFNRHGYYFDGIFYGYDRYYRYQDRLRGRGLFDGRYYMPANSTHYGFCQGSSRTYPRPFRR